MPVGMNRIHAAVIGDKVYAGGGITDKEEDAAQVSQYDLSGPSGAIFLATQSSSTPWLNSQDTLSQWVVQHLMLEPLLW